VLTVDGKDLTHGFRVEGEPSAVPRFLAEEEEKEGKGGRIDD
jgi:hypothetical protein